MLIRKMTIEDYDNIFNLWLSTPGIGLNTIDDSRAGIEKYLLRNPNTCFIAEENNNVIGSIMSGHDGRKGFIIHTAVKACKQKRGIGSMLVNAALASLKNEGINKVALVAYANNKIGNTFWEKHGFYARTDITYRDKKLIPLELIK